MLYGPEERVPPAPVLHREARCALCGGTQMLDNDIPCPACHPEVA